MAFNLKILGNLIAITDIPTSVDVYRASRGESTFKIVAGDVFEFYTKNVLINTQNFADLIDNETGLAFPSVTDLEVFLSLNIGNPTFTAGAVPVPTSVGLDIIKTGAATYRTGDDGELQQGRLVDWTTLESNNPFGNDDRFTDTLGGQTYANDIVIDWSTYDAINGKVRGLYRYSGSNTDYATHETNVAALNPSGFTGWTIGNDAQVNHVMKKVGVGAFNYAPLLYPTSGSIWTSTFTGITNPFCYTADTGVTFIQTSLAPFQRVIPFRLFTVTGTVLT